MDLLLSVSKAATSHKGWNFHLLWQAQGYEMITVFTFPLLTIKSHSAALPRMTEANKIQAFGRKQ